MTPTVIAVQEKHSKILTNLVKGKLISGLAINANDSIGYENTENALFKKRFTLSEAWDGQQNSMTKGKNYGEEVGDTLFLVEVRGSFC